MHPPLDFNLADIEATPEPTKFGEMLLEFDLRLAAHAKTLQYVQGLTGTALSEVQNVRSEQMAQLTLVGKMLGVLEENQHKQSILLTIIGVVLSVLCLIVWFFK